MRLDAVKVQQGHYTFFLFKIDAKKLLSIAKIRRRTEDPLTGIQRMLDKTRLSDIGDLIKSDLAVFPNSLVVQLPDSITYDENTKTLEIPDNPESVFVIDGQHRLWSFDSEYSPERTMDLPVSGFVGLTQAQQANIFVTINRSQRKINPSLVYDLFPFLRQTETLKFEDIRAQSLVEALYSEEPSPWYHRISMLGDREFLITQASFVSNIKQLFRKEAAFTWDGLGDETLQKELLFRFFERLSKVFRNAWLNEDYVLCKNIGVGASIRLMNSIMTKFREDQVVLSDETGLRFDYDGFDDYLTRIPEATFDRKTVGQEYLGESGIRRFADRLNSLAGLPD